MINMDIMKTWDRERGTLNVVKENLQLVFYTAAIDFETPVISMWTNIIAMHDVFNM